MLNRHTHTLAQRALAGEHSAALVKFEHRLSAEALAKMSENMQAAHYVRLIGERAPLRLQPGEFVVGSATLYEATLHMTPGWEHYSVSHTTLGFDEVLRVGYAGLRQRIERRLTDATLDEDRRDFLNALLIVLQGATAWHRRTMDELQHRAETATETAKRDEYARVRENLRRVPELPPINFREAVQSLWFAFAFQRLCGTWSGIGRIDKMLGAFLRQDLDNGTITLDEAREYIAHFWIKGAEWAGASEAFGGSGDAQFYQNIVLGGIDADGNEVTNEVTWLVLDVVEELRIGDFPVAVRVSERTPPALFRRIAEVQRAGGGIVAIYNEDVVIAGLQRLGIETHEAREFANDGCWEAIIPGKTCFSYVPFDLVQLLQTAIGTADPNAEIPNYADFEGLYAAFLRLVEQRVNEHHALADDQQNVVAPATPLVSLLIDGCIESGKSYYDHGPRYRFLALHAGGMANVGDCLSVIRRLVFEEKRLSFREFMSVLRNNYEGHETLRQRILKEFEFFGNDNDTADAMVRRVFDDYTEIMSRVPMRNGVYRPAGLSTFGREIAWCHDGQDFTPRKATADGHRCGKYLATNFSPTPGAERYGPTAVISSYCKQDFTRTPNGATLELKLHPQSVTGDNGADALAALLRAFVRQGGWFLQVEVVDTELLRDAQQHPEKYPNLPVRVSGWSARFATLNREWQDMIINRTQQRFH